MLRTGFGVACIALLGAAVGCTTDVEDPGFTATAGMSSGSSGDDDTTPGSTSSTDPSATSVAEGTGESDETGDPPGTTTGSPGSTSTTTDDPTTGDPGGCGDGVVSPGEQCDGADLQGLDCTSLGLGTGTLGCDPMMCTFDTSMCMSDSGGTSG